jgi:LysM repeat protein
MSADRPPHTKRPLSSPLSSSGLPATGAVNAGQPGIENPSGVSGPNAQGGQGTMPLAPGVYSRPNNRSHHSDIDALWGGTRSYFKDDRSGLFAMLMGFVLGSVVTTLLFVGVFNQPFFQHWWQPNANTASSQASSTPAAATSIITPVHTNVVVEKGDTLSNILDREYHNTAMRIQQQVIQVNQLDKSGIVQAGQRLNLPKVSL